MEEEKPVLEPKKGLFWTIFKEILILAFIVFGIVFPIRFFIAEPYIVSGASMDPTFKTGDYLIVNKISHRFSGLERNAVAVFKYPNDTSKNFIKRIIGIPGDTVIVNGDEIKIVNKENPDGFVLDQSYVVHKLSGNFQKTLGEGEYFAMGDNRAESFDSRFWGILPEKDILGQPILQLFPFSHISIMPGDFK